MTPEGPAWGAGNPAVPEATIASHRNHWPDPGTVLAHPRGMPSKPIRSEEWLARLALVGALGASEVAVAALAGLSLPRLAVLAAAAFAFVIAYLVAPPPGNLAYDRHALRPVLAMTIATLIATGATGGLSSPLLPLFATPFVVAWTLHRPRTADLTLAAAPLGLLLFLLPCTALPDPHLSRAGFAAVAGWTTFLTAWLLGRRISSLIETHRRASDCLSRVREGVLTDAASRRRGLESMTTKLAHELKNPLAAIKTLLSVELDQTTDEKSRRRLDVVLSESERIRNTLRDYLELARPTGEMHLARFQLDELMAEINTLLAGRADAAGVDYSVSGSGGTLEADQRMLKEAIMNLVSNAIEATPRGGAVSVTYELAPEGAIIEIRDNGEGMPKAISARIGTPFFTTRDGGTGLGVAIARTAIAQHRGTLDYESTPGVGTTAKIALPLLAPRKESIA